MKILSIILLAMSAFFSLISFILCAFDKHAAIHGARRVPEKHFFLAALLGGGAGLWLGMLAFRHKTRHWYFWLAAVGSTVLWATLLIFTALKTGGAI